MKVYLGPWQSVYMNEGGWRRMFERPYIGYKVIVLVWNTKAGWFNNFSKIIPETGPYHERFNSMQIAMDNADEYIKQNLDYVLLTQEQFDKFRILI